MEIPVINRIIDFETNINPSLFSQVSAVSGIGKFYQTYNLWKWGALILALIASFTTIITRIKLLIVKLQKHPALSPSQYHLLDDDDDYESDTDSFSSDDEGEKEEEEEEEEEEELATTSFSTSHNWPQVDEDFHVKGYGHVYIEDDRNLGLRRRRRSIGDLFSWSELMTSGKNVVKLWDNLGLELGLNMDDDSENEFTIYDMNTNREVRKIASVFGRKDEIPAFVSTSSTSPAVIVSAAVNDSDRVTFSAWDTRIGSRLPAILAEWSPKFGNIVGIKAGGIGKVFVRDYVSNALTVGDMRKVNSPVDDPIEADVDMWWEADAVIVTDECLDDSN